MSAQKNPHQGTLFTYVAGFILSVGLTIVAYLLVTKHVYEGWTLIYALVGLAVVQLFVQMFFFLHLGQEPKPRWNLGSFLFMLLVLLIIVVGSLWIMHNLNYNMMMSPDEMNKYVQEEEGIYR